VALSGSVLVNDGRGGPSVVDIVRTCEGRRLRLQAIAEGALDPMARALSGAATPTLGGFVELAPNPVAQCTTPAGATDRAGLSVLGNTAQGVLIARGDKLLLADVAPPSAAAAPTAARELAPNEPAPALLAPSALSADGLTHVVVSSEGVVVITRGASVGARLVRTPPSCTQAPSDAAISPSGARVAMLCGGQVYIAEPATAAAPAVPEPPATPVPPEPSPVPAVPVTALPPPEPEPAPTPPPAAAANP
jgi:hypothetical protein